MYATVHQFHRSVPTESPGWADALADALHGGAPVGSCTLTQLAGLEGCVVAFWPTEEAAAAALDRQPPPGPVWSDATAYRVVDSFSGEAVARTPEFAQLTCFDSLSPAETEASDRAGRERLWPAVRNLPGLVSAHVLRASEGRTIILVLATDLETHEQAQRAVFATELLPWEDPALLRDPDRVQVARVVAARLPMTAGATS